MATSRKSSRRSDDSEVLVHFKFAKQTPGAVRYEEVDADGDAKERGDNVIGPLYIRKNALRDAGLKKIPKRITATIAFE